MSKIKVKIRMDPSSQITVESAEMVEVEYIEVEEPVAACPPEAAPEAEAEAEAEAEPEAEAEAGAEEPAAEEPAAEEEKPKMEKKRKKKTKKTPLTVTASTWEQPQAELQAKIEMLLELETADRLSHMFTRLVTIWTCIWDHLQRRGPRLHSRSSWRKQRTGFMEMVRIAQRVSMSTSSRSWKNLVTLC